MVPAASCLASECGLAHSSSIPHVICWLATNYLRAARGLAGNEAARAFFATLSGANRYAILYRIADAKRAETRARRIAKYVAMLAAHEAIHPQR